MFGTRVCKECTKLEQRLTALESEVSKLRTEQIDILAQLKMIRDKVLRRFRREDDEPTEKSLISNPFLAK